MVGMSNSPPGDAHHGGGHADQHAGDNADDDLERSVESEAFDGEQV